MVGLIHDFRLCNSLLSLKVDTALADATQIASLGMVKRAAFVLPECSTLLQGTLIRTMRLCLKLCPVQPARAFRAHEAAEAAEWAADFPSDTPSL